jgi:hypothetical protein
VFSSFGGSAWEVLITRIQCIYPANSARMSHFSYVHGTALITRCLYRLAPDTKERSRPLSVSNSYLAGFGRIQTDR